MIFKIGQVSLPVLSRKGRYDHWNYNWVSVKNYSLHFNEDLFLKKFFFLFFMYTISGNKHFLPMFYKNTNLLHKRLDSSEHALKEVTLFSLYKNLNARAKNKYYVSKIYLCRYVNWVFVYLYIYSITNLRAKTLRKRIKLNYYNKYMLHQAYIYSKNRSLQK